MEIHILVYVHIRFGLGIICSDVRAHNAGNVSSQNIVASASEIFFNIYICTMRLIVRSGSISNHIATSYFLILYNKMVRCGNV
jgi:hypothetical protein